MGVIEHLLAAHGMKAVAFWPAHADWRNDPAFDGALAQARLVIVNGEGTVHHDRPAGRCLMEIGAAARARGIPAALINAGWEENGPELTAMLADFALVSARDSQGAAAMGPGPADLRVVPDLSLCSVPAAPRASGPRDGIGFTDNVDRMKSLELDRLRRACGGRVVSIHQGGDGGYLGFLRDGISMREDLKVPRRALGILRLRHLLWAGRTTDTAAFRDGLARLRLLVSGRFHACTLSLALGTPFVAQASNTGKIAALARDAGLDEWRTSSRLTPDEIARAADRGWSKTEERNRAAYVADARARAETLFADLRRLAA